MYYEYDGNLKRVKTQAGGKTIYSIYSSLTGAISYQDHVTENERIDYLSFGAASVRLINGANPVYTHKDHLGSPVAATDANGDLLWREAYTPFGEKWLRETDNDDRPGYTGHVDDESTRFTYMQARYYDSSIGRFLRPDPLDYQDQTNLYSYVHNDPLNLTDPFGLQGLDDEERVLPKVVVRGKEPDAGDDKGFGGIELVKALFNPNPNPTQRRFTEQQVQNYYEEAKDELEEAAKKCAAEEFGLGTAAGAGVAASGLPVLPTRPKPTGATQGTSPASVASRAAFGDLRTKDIGGPKRVWAPTLARPFATTNRVGTAVGRWAPGVGYAALAKDLADLNECISENTSN